MKTKLKVRTYNTNFSAACCEDKAMGDYQGGEMQLSPLGKIKKLIKKIKLRIAIAQLDSIVGDIYGNKEKIIKNAILARDEHKADIIVFPEMFLTGYPPEDLLFRDKLHEEIKTALKQIQKKVKGIYIIFGTPTKKGQKIFNAALVIYNGKILAECHKQELPNYDVFDDKRYFTAGTSTGVVNIKGVKIAILICEDLWFKKPMTVARRKAQLAIGINASPFDLKKQQLRKEILAKRYSESKLPIIYVNSVGGQDDLIFDGGSMLVNSKGNFIQCSPFFSENLDLVDLIANRNSVKITAKDLRLNTNQIKLAYDALVLGLKDYVEKNGFNNVIVGTSGGIDSALTLAIAVDALGKNHVTAVYLPSRYSSKLSQNIAKKQAKTLGVKYKTIAIEKVFKEFLDCLKIDRVSTGKDSTIENLQARARGVILMALANKENALVIATGNKSEMAVGYATLYGDMVGGFSPLKDVYKTTVYQLAKYRNSLSEAIPKAAITRAPTAELAKGQKDSDDLPSYKILDKILERHIELKQSESDIVAAGFNKKTVAKVMAMVNASEHKRCQSAPGPKITTTAFGRGRRYPITSKFEV